APYALTGDTEGDLRPWNFSPGKNTIRAVPFSKEKASGEKGKALTITVTLKRGAALRLVGNDTQKKDKNTEEQLAVSADNVGAVSVIEQNEWSVAVYPNPVSDVLHLAASRSGTYHLFGLQGIMEKTGEVLGGDTTRIDVSSVPAGVYYLRITTEEGTSSQKIIISR